MKYLLYHAYLKSLKVNRNKIVMEGRKVYIIDTSIYVESRKEYFHVLFCSVLFCSFFIASLLVGPLPRVNILFSSFHLSFATMVMDFSSLSNIFYLSFSLTLLLTVTGSPLLMDAKPSTPLVSFLQRLQQTAFNTFTNSTHFDPKTYVDLPLKFPLSITDQAFRNLPKSSNGSVSVDDLNLFIETYFEGAGDDLVYFDPEDFVPEPEDFLPKVKHPEVRAWALEVHKLWKNLSRKISSQVTAHPNYHTLLPLPDSVVIPGSRFREVYYWDSYWVIRFVFS